MWQIPPESKAQLVSWKLPSKSFLGISMLEEMHNTDVYIFWDSFHSVLLSDSLYILFDIYAQVLDFYAFQWTLFSDCSGFGKYAIQKSYDPHMKHIYGFWLLSPVRLFLGFLELKDELNFLSPFPFLCSFNLFSWVWSSTMIAPWARKVCSFSISY